MSKITCAICKNEENQFCKVKKIGVHVNKRRNCSSFILAKDKVKPVHLVKTIPMPYAEKEELKKRYKEELKKQREVDVSAPVDAAHPLTGDLSRFKSTAVVE